MESSWRVMKSRFYSYLFLSHISRTKRFWKDFAEKVYDKSEIRGAVSALNKAYAVESSTLNSRDLIISTHREVKKAEKNLPSSLRKKVKSYFRIVGKEEQRDNDVYNLNEYTNIKESGETRRPGYYSVPENYYRLIKSIDPETYYGTVKSMITQLRNLVEAKKMISNLSIIEDDFDLSLVNDEKIDYISRLIKLNNKMERTKTRLLACTREQIKDLQLRIGAYERFIDTSRKYYQTS